MSIFSTQIITEIAATNFPHFITKPSVDKCTPSLTNSNNSSPAILPNSDIVNETSHSGHQLKCDKTAKFDSDKVIIDKDCTECNISRPDPTTSQLIMFLHALSYQVTIVTVTSLTHTLTIMTACSKLRVYTEHEIKSAYSHADTRQCLFVTMYRESLTNFPKV